MTDSIDYDYEVDVIDIADLDALPYHRRVSSNIDQFNTPDASEVWGILGDAEMQGYRVTVNVHEEMTDKMLPLLSNEGHLTGMSASYLREISGSSSSLESTLADIASNKFGLQVDGLDFYQINVHKQ